jgi:hypothetical protein
MTSCTAQRSVQEWLDARQASCEGQEQLLHPLEIQALALTSLIGKAARTFHGTVGHDASRCGKVSRGIGFYTRPSQGPRRS